MLDKYRHSNLVYYKHNGDDEPYDFSQDFSKNTQTSNFMKIVLVGADLFHADRPTDMTKLTVVFAFFRTRLKAGVPPPKR